MGFKVMPIKFLDAHTSSSTIVTNQSLVGVPEKRGEVIHKASFCCQEEAINLRREDDPSKPDLYLVLAQQAHYFLGDTWRMLS